MSTAIVRPTVGVVPVAEQTLYKITVTATVRNTNGSIARNQAISFANYPQNANVKQVSYEGRTDSNGTAKAYYEVRGVTNFTVRAQCGRTQKSLSITPNEKCDYENTFYLTAYIIALESDYNFFLLHKFLLFYIFLLFPRYVTFLYF